MANKKGGKNNRTPQGGGASQSNQIAKLMEKENRLNKLETSLNERKNELDAREMSLNERETSLNEREKNETQDIRNKIKKFEERYQEKLANETEELNKEIEKLRDDAIQELESYKTKKTIEFENKLKKERYEHYDLIEKARQELIAEYETYRNDKMDALNREIEESRKKLNENFEKNLEIGKQILLEGLENREKAVALREKNVRDLEEREKKLEESEQDLIKRELQVKADKNKNEFNETLIKKDKENQESYIAEQIENRYPDLMRKNENQKDEIKDLKVKLADVEEQYVKLSRVFSNYGSDPEQLIKEFNKYRIDNQALKDKISNMYSKEDHDKIKGLMEQSENKADYWEKTYYDAQFKDSKYDVLEAEYDASQKKLETAQNKFNDLQKEYNDLLAKHKRLTSDVDSEEKENIRQKRLSALTSGGNEDLINAYNKENYTAYECEGKKPKNMMTLKETGEGVVKELEWVSIDDKDDKVEEVDEIKWLDFIMQQCDKFGVKFKKRIMYAFHTSLKISEWSMLTVLAGVSGTGKSELPKLYAAFGGLNFGFAAVQPNWDSQESMLGYFNSIDNRFEPQPILRHLYKFTEDEDYKNIVSLFLLDEMNLAHVEYYFAEFLSALERRRSRKVDDVPKIDINLGAGVEPFELKLLRNIMWVGTMNQDETTKSLSDKVLDRGVVINFPRPIELADRNELVTLDKCLKKSNRPKMHKRTWESWLEFNININPKGENYNEALASEFKKYKKLLEDINEKLDPTGRALGHRVWQSMAYYAANYPTVRARVKELDKQGGAISEELKKALHTAFEDQIVQKVAPKLRGIELTRGGVGDRAMGEILGLLDDAGFDNLDADFNAARNNDSGQFMWNSAKYLEKEV